MMPAQTYWACVALRVSKASDGSCTGPVAL